MIILGIESSCDETAAAIVENGKTILSNVVNSQIDIHAVYGGVIPEIAARSHIEAINPVINKAISDSKLEWKDIDAIAVAYGPGLVGSLLIGTLAAKTLAILKNKPLYPVHHVEAHVYSNFLRETPPRFPILSLIVSGGHSQIVLFRDHGDYIILGQTQDDAVGEAFDKVAKIIGLPYPGGPAISKISVNGNPYRHKLPKAHMKNKYDFSFSGLKTAVLRAVQKEVGVNIDFPSYLLSERLNDTQKADFAASFQRIAIESLVDQLCLAYEDYSPASIVIGGGVSASMELRNLLSLRIPLKIEYAPIKLCTDNAAMIASLGYYYAQKNEPMNPYDLEVKPSISMDKSVW